MQAITSLAGFPTLRPWSLDIALRGRRQRNVRKTLIAPIPLTPTYSPTWLPQENWKLKGNKHKKGKKERKKLIIQKDKILYALTFWEFLLFQSQVYICLTTINSDGQYNPI